VLDLVGKLDKGRVLRSAKLASLSEHLCGFILEPLEEKADERILPERAEGFRDEFESAIYSIIVGTRAKNGRHRVLAAKQGCCKVAFRKSSGRPPATRRGDAPGNDLAQPFLNFPIVCLLAQPFTLTDFVEDSFPSRPKRLGDLPNHIFHFEPDND